MKEILPNIYAIEVQKDAEDFEIYKDYLRWILNDESGGLLFIGKDYEILGTCTQNEIEFDVEPISDVWESKIPLEIDGYDTYPKVYLNHINSFYELNTAIDSFRSALTASGITQYEKLIIIKKI